ncbi:flagellar basal body-associated protein FliL [Nocardioides mangrovicus]|uniref:Flagellar protein FliL n=1 Tax=Nocardioides mangrovicus TaxID=2478913 RepID=A0A3L8P2J2_9ACTN|nr:flagellar basal body-associated FliL family protein [Nocardioides mangrovicus]RLV49384.1 flagellar basal body-associated protein FliL [Nocardioides mangrovicus]
MTVTAMPETAAGAAAGEEAPKKGKKKLILIVLVLLLVVGGAAYWFVLRPTGPSKPQPGTVSALDSIQVNLAGDHYLRVGIALQLTAGTKEADGSKALDATINEFSGLTVAEVTDPAKRRALKKELAHRLEELYEGEVMGVYFTEFVTQ